MVAPASRALRLSPLALLLAVLLAPLAGCDKVALTAPTQSTITLFSSATVVPVNGSAEITANVIEQAGTPVQNGTLVTFTTTLGSVDPREARTNNGRVTVRFTAAGTSGRASVVAFSGSAQSDALEITVGAAAASRVVLNVTPGSLPVGGGTVTITATVTDENGNRLPGVPVTFTASSGTLLNGTVLTDPNGEARTTLTATRQTQVTASAGNQQAQVTIDVSTPVNLTLTAPSQSPTVGATTTFTVGVTAGTNSAPLREVTIDFGDGNRLSLGTPSGSVAVTHVYRAAGTYTVTATATDTTGAQTSTTTQVTVVPAGRPLVTLTVPGTVAANAIFTASVAVTQNPNNIGVDWVEFSFGDGNVKRVNSLQTTHAYGPTGNYNVRATVRFIDGQQASAEAGVRVVATLPTTGSSAGVR